MFPDGSDGKASVCSVGDPGLIPGLGRSPGEGNGNPLQYSWLENSMDWGAYWATVHGVTKSQTRLSDFTFSLSNPLYDPAILLLDTDPKQMNVYIHRKTYKGIVTVTLFLTAKNWKHPKYPSVGKKIKLWCIYRMKFHIYRMWDLVHNESWAPKNWCFWTVVLEKTLESPLDCKEIQPVHPKGNKSWIFIGRTDAEAEAPTLWPADVKSWLTGKDPDARQDWRQEEKGTTEDATVGWYHQLNGHEFEQALGVVMDREAWRTAIHGVAKSQTWLSDWTDWLKHRENENGKPSKSLLSIY